MGRSYKHYAFLYLSVSGTQAAGDYTSGMYTLL
jgi:hypothetical protein